MAGPPVTFFLDGEGDLDLLAGLDLERDWRQYARGERAWVLQTYLRLRRAGHPAAISDRLPESGLVVFHAKQKRRLAQRWRGGRDLYLVGVRADNREPAIADFEIVQNGCYADSRRRFWIPFWPQAGLIRRDESRGAAIRRASFKGFSANLHPDLRGPEWTGFLAERGIEWEEDMVPYEGRSTAEEKLAWNDYSQTDLIVALRPQDPKLYTSKPATKLYNAWQAGVPAILGPEHAYRELRRSPFDFFEIATLEEAKQAVTKLVEDPALYQVMVANGRRRVADFSFDRTTERWAEVLYRQIPARLGELREEPLRRLPLGLRSFVRRIQRTLARRPAI